MSSGTVIVAREAGEFSLKLRENGVEVIDLPLIETRALADKSEVDTVLGSLDDYDGLFFTSLAAAEAFSESTDCLDVEFAGKFYALGERCRRHFELRGISVEATDAQSAEELVSSFDASVFAGKRFLFLRGTRSLRTIPEMLGEIATVDELLIYSSQNVEIGSDKLGSVSAKLARGSVDWVCFFSPSAVERFVELFGSNNLRASIKIAAIGTTTADAARRAGFEVGYVSQRTEAAEFAEGFLGSLRNGE